MGNKPAFSERMIAIRRWFSAIGNAIHGLTGEDTIPYCAVFSTGGSPSAGLLGFRISRSAILPRLAWSCCTEAGDLLGWLRTLPGAWSDLAG